MAKFIYRMQNILDIKYKLEEQAKQHYMEVRIRLNEALEELAHLENRKQMYFKTYRGLVSERLDLLEIENCKNAILIIDDYIIGQKETVASIEKELEQAAAELEEIMKDRKMHERLKENQFELFLQELNREELKEIDQLVSYQYNNRDTEEEV